MTGKFHEEYVASLIGLYKNNGDVFDLATLPVL